MPGGEWRNCSPRGPPAGEACVEKMCSAGGGQQVVRGNAQRSDREEKLSLFSGPTSRPLSAAPGWLQSLPLCALSQRGFTVSLPSPPSPPRLLGFIHGLCFRPEAEEPQTWPLPPDLPSLAVATKKLLWETEWTDGEGLSVGGGGTDDITVTSARR